MNAPQNNDEIRMTRLRHAGTAWQAKLEGMTNDKMTNDCDLAFSSFGLRASFVIRHSCFVISCGFSDFESHI